MKQIAISTIIEQVQQLNAALRRQGSNTRVAVVEDPTPDGRCAPSGLTSELRFVEATTPYTHVPVNPEDLRP